MVDRNTRLVGAVDEEAIVTAVAAGKDDLTGILDTEVASVSHQTQLTDCLALSADTPKALAVVDDDGRVVGVLARVTLLQALGQRKARAAQAAEPSNGHVARSDNALVEGSLR